MDVSVKEEAPIEIEGYVIIDTTSKTSYSDSEDDGIRPSKKRKLSHRDVDSAKKLDAKEEMQQLLQEWGLAALSETFSQNLIDSSVLDYILDVDIVDLCRDFPMRYRLILRHKLAEKRGKSVGGCPRADSCASKENHPPAKSISQASIIAQENWLESRKPSPSVTVKHIPKRANVCAIDMLLNKAFAERSDDEKRLLVSMDIPRPDLPHLRSTRPSSTKNTTITRKFHRSRYDATWWLCGSPKHNRLYCWPCLLFHTTDDNVTWLRKGFNDLNHLSAAAKAHSSSQRHMDNVTAYENYGRSTVAYLHSARESAVAENVLSANAPKKAKTPLPKAKSSTKNSDKGAQGKDTRKRLVQVKDERTSVEDLNLNNTT